MLRQEVEDKNDSDVKKTIKNNPNFELEKETIKVLATSKDWNDRKIAAEQETDSLRLNEMLRQEIQKYNDDDIKKAIRDNPNFEIEKVTIRVLAGSRYWADREIAAKEETDSSKLNDMLRGEVQGENDWDVINAIRNNSNFKLEEATIKVFANSMDAEDRIIAAEEETNSSRLNEMLRQELEGQDDSDVKEVIGENPNFELEESTIELLVNSTYIEDRIIVAKNRKVSIEILESMYLKESSSEVLRVIEDNLKERVFAKKSDISFAQKVQIEKVLRKAVKSKGKALIPELLNEILEIIS